MKAWAAIGILIAAAVLGAIGYVTIDQYVYANGININWKLIAIVGALAIVVGLFVAGLLRKKAS